MFEDKEFDHDDGTPVFELEFTAGGNKYEYDVHAVTGKIIKAEHEVISTPQTSQGGQVTVPSGNTNYGNTNYDDNGTTNYGNSSYSKPATTPSTPSQPSGTTNYDNKAITATAATATVPIMTTAAAITAMTTMTTTMTTTIATTTKAQPAEDRTQAAPMRHEMKHQISPAEDLVLSRRLRQLFAHDNYAGEDGTYLVTSLYFDTPYDDAVREKLAGVSRREKFRLRYTRGHFFYQAGKEIQAQRTLRQAQRKAERRTGAGADRRRVRFSA